MKTKTVMVLVEVKAPEKMLDEDVVCDVARLIQCGLEDAEDSLDDDHDPEAEVVLEDLEIKDVRLHNG